MVNRRSSRIVGTSRSNSHQSRNQSMNHRRPISASFYPGGKNAAGEGTSGPSLEERIRKMEESHNEILQLLRETRQPALPQREEVFLPRDPPGLEEVQPEHLQVEIPLPPPRRHSQSHHNNEVADTASSTHPNLLEDLAQAHVAEFPRNALRHELRRLRAFSHYGDVLESKVINDQEIGRSRGFGFVTYGNEQAMRDAIEGMNGQNLDGRNITVNQAQSRSGNGGGGGGGDGGYCGGGGGGYGGGGVYRGGRSDGGYGGGRSDGGYSHGGGGGRDRGYDGGSRYSSGGGGSDGNWRN
ncbi:hypothetical protein M5K25_009103 [Dendrobium thyrsiflorum]|uniref:RRM domain-containing protein n=1 Tax=Dendrobium thyrsiflorum TaxID=117978 RepID=A0ABD0V4M5_DENTH